MAYNVLKGKVEGSVDQHADQEIDGVKVFKNTVSGSGFYDTDAESLCATLKDVPLRKLKTNNVNGVLTYQGDHSAKAEYNLKFDGKELTTKDIRADRLFGSGAGLHDIPTDRFSGSISAHNLHKGSTLKDSKGYLQVNTNEGLHSTKDGLSVLLHSNGALDIKDRHLVINPKKSLDITARGQNLSDADILVVYDASRGDVRRTTLSNFYDSYINTKTLQPEGPLNSIQLRGRKGLSATAALTFDSNKTLNVGGTLRADQMTISDKAVFNGDVRYNGAIYRSIKTINEEHYEIIETDHTILANTTDHVVTITLPPADEYQGRELIIKKINNNKYKLNSNVVYIIPTGDFIDMRENMIIKYNYGVKTIQSDGENWWVINRTGS